MQPDDDLDEGAQCEAAVESELWAQLGALCGLTGSGLTDDPARLHQFMALFEGIISFRQSVLLEAVEDAGNAAADFQQELMRDDWLRGVCYATRRECARHGEPVPDWILHQEAVIEQRRAALAARVRSRRRPIPVPVVH